MFRTFFRILSLLLFAFAIVGGYFWTQKVEYLETYLEDKLRVGVEVDSLTYEDGFIVARNIRIDNPPNSTVPAAFTCSALKIKAEAGALLDSVTTIEEIVVEDPLVAIELYSSDPKDTNWAVLMAALARDLPKSDSDSSDWEIQKATFRNTQMILRSRALDRTLLSPPPVEEIILNDIGTAGELSAEQAMMVLFKRMMSQTANQSGVGLIDKVAIALEDQFPFLPAEKIHVPGKVLRGQMRVLESKVEGLFNILDQR